MQKLLKIVVVLLLICSIEICPIYLKTNDTTVIYTVSTQHSSRTKYKLTSYEKKLLACLVYCEAGAEPYTGKKAVVNVVMNRVKSKKFPNTISKVIKQKGQFGPYSSGKLSREMIKYDKGQYKNKRDTYRYKSACAVTSAINSKSVVGNRCFFNTARYTSYHKNSIIIGSHKFW